MATNVAGAGKPSPQEPDPKSKSASAAQAANATQGSAKPATKPGAKPAAATDSKSASADAKSVVSSGKSTAAGGKTAEPNAEKSPAKSKAGFNELNDLKKVGKYEIVKKIGQGGMGAVFLAKDTQLKRQVALKVLPKDKAENPTLVKRFKAEAQAAAALKHDNIVAIHDAGEADGLLYIALEYIEGTDAHTIVAKRGPMPVKRAMEVIRQTAAALQHAHEQKIVHRDIKPSNLLIRKDGLTKLADMGLARSIDESLETNITRAGTTVGTVDYMSPEQARNSKAADIRSDLYSLGATWYHLLAGHPPFPDGSMLNKLTAHSVKARPDIRDLNEAVPENISVMIKRMMAVKPEDRYQTPQELLEDLDNDNLTRGPMTLKDLAALAEEDDEEDEDQHAPKAAYKKPGAQEAKQLMAPTMELPVMPTKLAEDKPAGGMDTRSLKTLGIVLGITIVVGGLWYVVSGFGDSTAVRPGQNPFDRDIASNDGPKVIENDATKKSDDPKPEKKSPKSLTPQSPSTTASTKDSEKPIVPPSGTLYLPPISPLGRDGEIRFVSDWITSGGTPVANNLKTIFVGGGTNGFDNVATLDEALRQLPDSGGVVELATEGPYFLTPTELLNKATVVIRGMNSVRPLVVLVADPDQPYDTLLKVTNGALTLEGLQVLVYARQFATSDPLTLISVRGGDLAAVNCSFTLNGTRAGKTFVFGAEGKVIRSDAKVSPHCRLLTRDCVIRGAALGAFQLDQAMTDLVASHCLFATGSGPVLSLTNHHPLDDIEPATSKAAPATSTTGSATKSSGSKAPLKPSAGSAAKGATPSAPRSLKFLSCSILANSIAFELAPGSDPKPPMTEVTMVNSVIAGNSVPQSSPVLLALPGWPQNPLPKPDQNLYDNLRWTFESSLICGWQKLISEEPGSTTVVRTGGDWKRDWRNQPMLDESQFQASAWPKTPLVDLVSAKGSDFAVPADAGVKSTDGQPLGWPAMDFMEPTPITLARSAALADRMRHPVRGWESLTINKTITIDANMQDIGQILNSESWPSGTLAIVSGTGNVEMSPVEVKGKSLRIEFKNTGEAPLVFSPRKLAKLKDDEAMFLVEGGSLEVVGGQFRFPNSSTQPLPQFFLSVHDGDFALRGCTVIGQTLDGTSKYIGLIRWKRSEAESKNLTLPSERNSGLITDSALITTGRLLDADMRNRTLLLRNSVFASIGDLFDLNVQGFEKQIGATLDARWCTFGAGGKYLFQVRGTKDSEKATQPFHAFLENCALLTLTDLSGATASPVLLSVRDHVLANQQLSWWDYGNGYQMPWSQFVRPADTPAKGTQAFDTDWKNLWGPERVVRPLTTSGGVRLAAKLPHRSKLGARDFQLARDSASATWGTGLTGLGADLDRKSSELTSTINRGSSSSSNTAKPETKPDPTKAPVKKIETPMPKKTQKLDF